VLEVQVCVFGEGGRCGRLAETPGAILNEIITENATGAGESKNRLISISNN
jgi:hypothetical protein